METVAPSATTARHPLDPLSAEEIEAASGILRSRGGLAGTARFVYVTLHEPDKAAVLRFRAGDPIDRQAFALIREGAERRTYEAVVSLTSAEVRPWRERPGVQPPIMSEEVLASEEAIRRDPRCGAVRPRPHAGARGRGPRRGPPAAARRQLHGVGDHGPRQRPPLPGRAPDRCRGRGDHAARRARLPGRRPRGALAEVAPPRRLHASRGPGSPRCWAASPRRGG